MANRAYLYSVDDFSPDAWPEHRHPYYDSRWDIPLAWYFLFLPEDLLYVKVHFRTSIWREVKFAAHKEKAISTFQRSRERLMAITDAENYNGAVLISHFLDTLSHWPGSHLLLDPFEVVDQGEIDFDSFSHFLQYVHNQESTIEEIVAAVPDYTSLHITNATDFAGRVLGYTYGYIPVRPKRDGYGHYKHGL